jgi:AAA+ superfamily predicted ATPase
MDEIELRSTFELESILLNKNDKDFKENNSYNQWSFQGNGTYIPSYLTINNIPPGYYELGYDNSRGCPFFKSQNTNSDELYTLPTKEIKSIISDLETFWNSKEKYDKLKIIYKRGILLWGDPGCGKSGIINICCNYIIEQKQGIVINIKNDDVVDCFIKYISIFRNIEPNRPLIVLLEDIDSIVGDDRWTTSQVLNILDGVKQINNVVYIATTNYPERLEDRIQNRPSRFDRKYKIELPDYDVRKVYLENKLLESNIDLDYWAQVTDGLSLSHLKEIIISTQILGMDIENAVETLTGMKVKARQGKKIGFK